jgi:hypothetical protein
MLDASLLFDTCDVLVPTVFRIAVRILLDGQETCCWNGRGSSALCAPAQNARVGIRNFGE